MRESNKGVTVLSNLIWRFLERCGAQLVALIVSVVLARLLNPTDYGMVAMVTVVITIFQVFVDSGLGNALIQKKDADNLDFSTVFYANIAFCIMLYLLIYVAAPYFAAFYENSRMTVMIRVLGITILVSGLKNVQQAYVSRHMLFKRFFFSTLLGTISAAIVGIIMAYHGFGVWALVTQQLVNVTIDTLILWLTVQWRPGREFSVQRFKKLYAYGWKLLAANLLETIYQELRQVIIGKIYSSADLAFYNQGRKFPFMIISNINSSIDSVLLPALANEQDKKEYVKNMTRSSIKVSVYVIAPLMMWLCFTAPSVVRLILTDKWMACVPYLRIFCISFMFYPIHMANLNVIKAMGRSDYSLKVEIVKKIVQSILLFSAMWFGVFAMACSVLVESFFCLIINSWPNRKLINYGYLEQLKDILAEILIATVMGICIYPMVYIRIPLILVLFLQVAAGLVIYIGLSLFFKIDTFWYIVRLIRSLTESR